jgi:hypothetical protein
VRLPLTLLALSMTASADTAPPHQLTFNGKRLDLAAGKVVGDAGPVKCNYHDGAYWKDREHPDVVRWDKGMAADSSTEQPSFAQKGRRHILYRAHWGRGPLNTVVVDARDGKRVLTVQQPPSLLVEDGAGQLLGLLVIDREKEEARELRFLDKSGAVRWRVPRKDLWGDSGEAIVVGDRLIVSVYNRISTGSHLFSVELATGKLAWNGDVEQLQIGHSKYFNDVVLSLHGPNVVMIGREAGGCYVQIFDATTGARRLSLTNTQSF